VRQGEHGMSNHDGEQRPKASSHFQSPRAAQPIQTRPHITTDDALTRTATEPAICAHGAAVSSISESARPRMTFVVVRVATDAEELAKRPRHEPRQFRLELGQNVLAIITHDGSSALSSTAGRNSTTGANSPSSGSEPPSSRTTDSSQPRQIRSHRSTSLMRAIAIPLLELALPCRHDRPAFRLNGRKAFARHRQRQVPALTTTCDVTAKQRSLVERPTGDRRELARSFATPLLNRQPRRRHRLLSKLPQRAQQLRTPRRPRQTTTHRHRQILTRQLTMSFLRQTLLPRLDRSGLKPNSSASASAGSRGRT
jgi:hypothetical protein